MHEESDGIGRSLLIGLGVWSAVAGLVWLTLWLTLSRSRPASDDPQVAVARQVFEQRCAACHGSTGHGDGPAAVALTPRPRGFADDAWQDSVTDEHIEKVIKLGGTAVGKSAAMPANPDLQDNPGLVIGLRRLIRSYR